MQNKKLKLTSILTKVKACLDNGNYRLTQHALNRKDERTVLLPEILHVLRTGYHEKIKDYWDEAFSEWNYAIRGKTVDQQEIRVIISFDEMGLLIITVIRLGDV